jgi:hypothetical protein
MARVETSTSADWARRPAAVSRMRVLTVIGRDYQPRIALVKRLI